jgi:hypothetical protein
MNRHEQGWMSLDALGSLLVMAIMIPVLHGMWQMGANYQKKTSVARHFMTVQQAAVDYGKRNSHVLLPQVTKTSGPSVTIANLQSAGCLPARYSATNAWKQGYSIVARKDDTGALAMVVMTTGGRGHSAKEPDFANIQVPETAALAKAGFVPVDKATVLRGAYQGWEVTLASMGLTGTPGHLGAISTLSASDIGQDFLYRVAVPGRPELNAMQTSLNMSGNAVEGIGELGFLSKSLPANFCATSADEGKVFLDKKTGLYLCRNGKTVVLSDTDNSLQTRGATVGTHNQLITKPVCPSGTGLKPQIFVAPSIMASGADSPAMSSVQAWAVDESDTQWRLKMRILTANNKWVSPGANYGRMFVMTTCGR